MHNLSRINQNLKLINSSKSQLPHFLLGVQFLYARLQLNHAKQKSVGMIEQHIVNLFKLWREGQIGTT